MKKASTTDLNKELGSLSWLSTLKIRRKINRLLNYLRLLNRGRRRSSVVAHISELWDKLNNLSIVDIAFEEIRLTNTQPVNLVKHEVSDAIENHLAMIILKRLRLMSL